MQNQLGITYKLDYIKEREDIFLLTRVMTTSRGEDKQILEGMTLDSNEHTHRLEISLGQIFWTPLASLDQLGLKSYPHIVVFKTPEIATLLTKDSKL